MTSISAPGPPDRRTRWGGADPLGSLSEITSAASSGDREGAVASLMGASGGLDGMLGFAFSIAYPSFKPMLEASIRKVTVTVLWKQGEREKRLEVVQFITKPQLPPPELEVDEDGNPIGAGSSSPGGGAPPGNPLGGLLGGGAR